MAKVLGALIPTLAISMMGLILYGLLIASLRSRASSGRC